MAYSEDNDGDGINAVANDVTSISVVNNPFAKLVGHVVYKAADTRLAAQKFDALAQSAHGSLSGTYVFRSKKSVKALYVKQRLGRPN
jgi:hypothetical protein